MLHIDGDFIMDKRELVDHLLRFHLPKWLAPASVAVIAGWDKDILDQLHRDCHTAADTVEATETRPAFLPMRPWWRKLGRAS